MKGETLVHSCRVEIADSHYEIEIFLRQDGWHIAKTLLAHDDILINDAESLEAALKRQQELLPLALDSRAILAEYRSSRN